MFDRIASARPGESHPIPLGMIDDLTVKFISPSLRSIPPGIRSIERRTEQELLARRRENGVGRGVQAMNNMQKIQVAMLRVGLTANGLHLVDGHSFNLVCQGKPTRHATVLQYRRLAEGETAPEIPIEARAGLRTLATDAVWTCHTWLNPNGLVCVDLVQRQPGVEPLGALVTRKGELIIVKTDRLIAEEEEDARIATVLLEELEGI